jgi:hypothetical protein
MVNNNDNQMSTLLLLLILGFLIYYLTKPNVENLSNLNTDSKTVQVAPVASVPKNNFVVQNKEPSDPQNLVNQIIGESDSNNNVYSFEPNTDFNDIGAELNTAFDSGNVPALTPDVVNVNKNNVSQYNAKDFLPKEINNEWFDTDFSQAKFNINDDKLINTERYIIGINTVGQSLKAASYDIRGAVPNPKFAVSPWNNSTIEADYNIKPLC